MSDDRFNRPAAPPPPLFFGNKERDLTKQVNDEYLERVMPYQILYYSISHEHTNYHPIYGEAIKKNFYPPIEVRSCMVEWGGSVDSATSYVDRESIITVRFHKRRLTADKDLFVRVGDFVKYGDAYYEIVKLEEPRLLFGQIDHKFEVNAVCVRSRKGNFDAT